MADNLNKRGASDRARVNLNEKHEVAYWTNGFGCSEARLREVVKAVGTRVDDVREYLTEGKPRSRGG